MPPPFDQFRQAAANPVPPVVNDPSASLPAAEAQATLELAGPHRNLAESYLSAQAESLLNAPAPGVAVAANPCRTLSLRPPPAHPGAAVSAGVYDVVADSLTLTVNCPGIEITQTAAHEMSHGLVRAHGLSTEI